MQRKDVSVASAMGTTPLNIEFQWAFGGVKWTEWLHLIHMLMTVNLSSDVAAVFRCKLNTPGVFSSRSMYSDLINTGPVFRHKYIWQIKVSLMIKIFM